MSCNVREEKPIDNFTNTNLDLIISENVQYEEHDKVTCGLLTKSGNLWFGTSNEGVYQYKEGVFTHFTQQNGLANNWVNCMIEDRAGNLWFGTNDGLSKFDGINFTTIQIPADDEHKFLGEWWSPDIIQCMLLDVNGHLWLGTGGSGVYSFNGESFTNYTFENDALQSDSLHHNYIQSMIEDTDGNLWFTSLTHGGVTRFDGVEFTHFSAKDGLKDDMVYSSFQDRAGKLWFGSIQTKFEGLYQFNGESFIGFGKEDGLCDNFVTGFFEDKTGHLWIMTGSVLCIYDGETFAPFMIEDGSNLRDVSFIMEDGEKNIWLGGKYGKLWKYDGKTLVDFTQKAN
jgi:ligand-binding sensor domain-containing protein